MADPITRLNEALSGRYVVERELGEGGMATVYLARDLKHNRNVALKVLKPELAAVVGAERFLAEIETTANLHHPHILPLFDSGEADRFLFYVMPYVEGETLRDRLDREKQLPVDEAVAMAVSIANALQHAHDRGVIHRDIKPGNILLQDGQPVVSDFGIAIAVGAAGGARMTETGLSIGTPYYMSPEQAAGDQVLGPAADLYALVAVLYEILVGDPPYLGSTAQAVLAKILQGDPVSATAARRSIPANVDAAIRKGLERLPADRFRSGSELARALTDPSFRHGEATGATALAGKAWNRLSMSLAGTTALFAALTGWALLSRPEPEPAPVERFSLGTASDRLVESNFAISPDGSALVYRGRVGEGVGLYVRTWDNLEPSVVPGTTEGAPTRPSISPDGSEVAFTVGNQLRVVPLRGGVTRTLSDSANCCAVWAPDGYVYFTGTPDASIYRVRSAGGARERVTETSSPDDFHFLPSVVPGRGVLYTVVETQPRIEALDFDTGLTKVITSGAISKLVPGYLVFATLEGDVLAAPFDADALETTGPAVPLVEGVLVVSGSGPFFDVSPSGTLVYWSGNAAVRRWEFVWMSRAGVATPVDPGWTFDRGDTNAGWSLSPDGTRLALRELTEDGYDIWVKELDDGPYSRLTFDEGVDGKPRWSPDGRRITFLSDRNGNSDVWSMPFDGTGEPELVLDFERSLSQGFLSPDGKWLILRTSGVSNVEGDRDIWAMELGVDTVPRPLISAVYDEGAPAVSHDSRWIAYNSQETGRWEVFLRPFPDVNTLRIQVSTNGGAGPLWSHGGDELFYVDGDDRMIAAHLDLSTTPPRVVEREVLFEVPRGYDGTVPNNYITGLYDIAPDDQRFLMSRRYRSESDEAEQPRFIVVRNWLTEVLARVPKG